jgi:putative transposase
VTRYRCVDDQRAAGFPVTAACEAAGVSTSGFYDWRQREAAGPTEREVAEAELVELMRDIFDASDGNYGSRGCTVSCAAPGLESTRSGCAG